ncbi:2-amino-4-hydroxy-6-hydroxymethyldihydropteridine diphosphokinase [Undibacterium squillarum]|uniref:2-amino-4-hydroxy-6- hydroxymethyldihydropteridine diphosphokinase n=1 Tax=Undibacterium squillarum TaxID=1131567 RepID=UPI0035B03F28
MMRASIGIGANLGDAVQTVQAAIAAIAALPDTALIAASSLYTSAPVDSSGDDYVNAVIQVETGFTAEALLTALQTLENQHGRERPYRNAPRTLDLDVLLYGNQEISSTTLQVPHPRMHERAFVLLPLTEIAPETQIPGIGAALSLLESVSDQRIRKLS